MLKLDILAIGAHPDDVELSCSGVLVIEKMKGKKTGILDLTRGELGTRGTPLTREQEAANAAKILEIDIRENIGLPDGFFENNRFNQLEVIKIIRKYKPEIVLCNAPEDRHPDHGKAAVLVNDACFLSGLRKIETQNTDGTLQTCWRPKFVFNYIQDRYLQPNFVIDISAAIQQKIDSICAYQTQFYNPNLNEPQTYISSPEFLEGVINRAKMFGKMIGVPYAEGFISQKMIGLKEFDSLVASDS